MKMSVLIVAATLLMATGAQERPSKNDVETSAKKVKELKKERIATLKAVVEMSVKLANQRRIEIRQATESRMALLKAELDAADKESDRIALYKDAVESLKQFETLAKAAYEAGRGTELERLAIHAKRLEVEIWWEQAKIKAAK